MTLLSYPNPALARAYYYKPIQTKKPTKGNLSGEKLLALIAVKGPNIGKGWLLKPNLASRARKKSLKGKSSSKELVVEPATIVQAGWLKSAKQARSKQASKLKEILVWQSMLASSGQLVKLVTYFKHALGSSMLRGGKPISSKLNRSCLKGRQIKTNKAREAETAESASCSQLSAWKGGQPRRNTYRESLSQLQEIFLLLLAQLVPDLAQKRGGLRRNTCSYRSRLRRNTCRESMSQLQERLLLLLVQLAQPIGRPRRNKYSYRIVIELAQKRGYAYMYVIGEWLALLNRQKQQPFKSSNRLSVGAIGPGGGGSGSCRPP